MCCTKHRAVCECNLEKPKQWACMKCTSLKEKCEWPKVGDLGPVVDKGKGKAKEKEAVKRGRRRRQQQDSGGGGSIWVEVWFQHWSLPGTDGQAYSHGGGNDQTDGLDRRLHMVCITVQQPSQCQPRNIFQGVPVFYFGVRCIGGGK